jgi:DNA-binding CsgD family transcriptional regulator
LSSLGNCLEVPRGPRGAETSENNEESVTVQFPHGSLASALTAGLATRGWRVLGDAADGPGVPVILAVDDRGHLPLPPISAAAPVLRPLILVGGLACLRELADGLLLGASAAVNADLPLAEVLGRVDAVLRAGPLQPDARDRLRGSLRQRKTELDRFEHLTDREAGILADLAAGLTATDIARRRPVALTTVRTQIAGILHKLEVPSQTAAVALTYRACHDDRVLAALRLNQDYG